MNRRAFLLGCTAVALIPVLLPRVQVTETFLDGVLINDRPVDGTNFVLGSNEWIIDVRSSKRQEEVYIPLKLKEVCIPLEDLVERTPDDNLWHHITVVRRTI